MSPLILILSSLAGILPTLGGFYASELARRRRRRTRFAFPTTTC